MRKLIEKKKKDERGAIEFHADNPIRMVTKKSELLHDLVKTNGRS